MTHGIIGIHLDYFDEVYPVIIRRRHDGHVDLLGKELNEILKKCKVVEDGLTASINENVANSDANFLCLLVARLLENEYPNFEVEPFENVKVKDFNTDDMIGEVAEYSYLVTVDTNNNNPPYGQQFTITCFNCDGKIFSGNTYEFDRFIEKFAEEF